MRSRISVLLPMVLLGACCLAMADSGEDWWKVVTGADISDGDAFLLFQARIQDEVDGGRRSCPTLGTAMGIDESMIEGSERIEYLRTWFLALRDGYRQRIAEVTRHVLCAEGWEDWSFDEIVRGLEKRASALTRWSTEDNERTLKILSEPEREAFSGYMLDLKMASSMTRYDTRGYYLNTAADADSTQASMCDGALAAFTN